MTQSLQTLENLLNNWSLSENFRTIDRKRRADLQRLYPGLPDDYLDYLETIGWGANQLVWYRIFDGPQSPHGLYDACVHDRLAGIVFFGGDYQGQNDGFDISRDYHIVEVRATDGLSVVPVDVQTTFTKFVTQRWTERYKEFIALDDE